jgi:hypothetical protein
MKKKLIRFAFYFLCLHFCLYFLFLFLVQKNSELVKMQKEYIQNSKKFEILILGDSHAVRGIDSRKINKCYSLAYYGENNIMCYYRLKHLIKNRIALPHYIILPADIFSFARGTCYHRTKHYFYYSFIPFNELNMFEENPIESKYIYLKNKIFPYSEIKSVIFKKNKHQIKKGFKRYSEMNNQFKLKEVKHLIEDELHCTNKKNLFYFKSINYLNKTISLCKENNIKLIYVKYPMTKWIYKEIKKNIDFDTYSNRVSERIIKTHNIPILDFEYLFENDDSLFFDSHHLNEYGKKKFTPILKQKLDSLLKVY